MFLLSLPMRGAWIEIETGAKHRATEDHRSSCGERGLKFKSCLPLEHGGVSLPMRGAWIEIVQMIVFNVAVVVAPHAGGVD